MTRKEYESCIFNQFVQTIIEPISDIQKNIDMYTEQNHGENYYDILRELMNTMDNKELKQFYDRVIQYYNLK